MNDEVRFQFFDKDQDRLAIANIDRLMAVVGDFRPQLPEHPARVAFRPEEYGPMVAIDSRDQESQSSEPARHLRSY